MDKQSREELVDRRKRELEEKELENEIKRDIRITSQQLRIEELLENSWSPYTTAAVRFLATLGILYIFFILAYITILFVFGTIGAILPGWFGPALTAIDPFFHAIIWIASIYSVYRKKSVLDDILEFLT